MKDPGLPLSGWQLDPIFMDNERVARVDLDEVSDKRTIDILHASGHIFNVNSKALDCSGLLRLGIHHQGITINQDGLPAGELYGPDAMGVVSLHVGFDRTSMEANAEGLRSFCKLCVWNGVTTITDLAARLTEASVIKMLKVTDH